jgi:hypothetical protein
LKTFYPLITACYQIYGKNKKIGLLIEMAQLRVYLNKIFMNSNSVRMNRLQVGGENKITESEIE